MRLAARCPPPAPIPPLICWPRCRCGHSACPTPRRCPTAMFWWPTMLATRRRWIFAGRGCACPVGETAHAVGVSGAGLEGHSKSLSFSEGGAAAPDPHRVCGGVDQLKAMAMRRQRHNPLTLNGDRTIRAGSYAALADAIRRAADLRVATEFRHNEHINT